MVGLLVLGLAGAAAVGCIEGPLVAELAFAADETFPNDDKWDSNRVRVDIQKYLNEYSPKHLSWYLYSPSARWRAVICVALSGHSETDPAKWAGVPAMLVHTLVISSNSGVRNLSLQALHSIPRFEKADVENILATLSVAEAPETRSILERLAERGGADSNAFSPTLATWLSGGSVVRRNAAFHLAVQHLPELDEESSAQFRKVLETSDANEKPWRLIQVLINRQPELGGRLLKGDAEDRRILWQALAARPNGPGGPAGMQGSSSFPTTNARNLPPGRKSEQAVFIEAAEVAAAMDLKNAAELERDLLINFLLTRARGFKVLMNGVDASTDEFAQAVFVKLPPLQSALSRGFERLDSKEAESFVAALPRLKGQARRRWGELMSIVGRPAGSRLFPSSGGPADPKHSAAFAKLLVDDESALWVASYFENIALLPVAEIGRIVGMLKRGLAAHAGPLPRARQPTQATPVAALLAVVASDNAAAPQAGLSAAASEAALLRYASLLHMKFPTHPDVVAFFKEFPKVEQEVSKVPPAGGRTTRG